ncbi:MAG: hypothetical protein OXH57_06850 [Ekhidna sp.]|nr:hypothetical protein [Ekhidna sp.]
MNRHNSIFRHLCLLCLILLMAACKKDGGGNRLLVFDADAATDADLHAELGNHCTHAATSHRR